MRYLPKLITRFLIKKFQKRKNVSIQLVLFVFLFSTTQSINHRAEHDSGALACQKTSSKFAGHQALSQTVDSLCALCDLAQSMSSLIYKVEVVSVSPIFNKSDFYQKFNNLDAHSILILSARGPPFRT